MKNNKGITLIALIVTIIVLIILAGISINLMLGNFGVITKTEEAKEENLKQTAKEVMNLKITSIQIENYTKNKTLPSLQFLADKLCEDNDMEYVLAQSKSLASLNKIDTTNLSSIYTKLKEYPYEFEINDSLQLASIDGVKVATVPTNDNDTIGSMTKVELESLIEEKVSKLEVELNTIKNNYQSMVNSSLVVFDSNKIVKSRTKATANTEISYTATENCAINYNYYFEMKDGGTGNCRVDDVIVAPVYTSDGKGYFGSRGIIYLKAGSVFKMKSVNYDGYYTVYGLK